MTAKLKALERAIEGERKNEIGAHVIKTNKLMAECIDLSQQPPVYAMSRDLRPISAVLNGALNGVRSNIRHYENMPEAYITDESRAVTLNDLRQDESMYVEAIARLAPSPQAVTVDELMRVVKHWFEFDGKSELTDSGVEVNLEWSTLADRLDQYLNNR